jgi:hypothetical protein
MGEVERNDGEATEVTTGPNRLLVVIGAGVGLFLIAFLLGFMPMWLEAHRLRAELATANHELTLNRWQNGLANATIDAGRGEYEPARQATSKFFDEVSKEITKTTDSAFTPKQAEQMKTVLAPRDDIITLLARSDPAAQGKLMAMHVAFRAAIAPEPAAK